MFQSKSLKFSIIIALCFSIMGCLSFGPLKYRQVKMLKKEGFVLTEEGWTLGVPERLLFEFNKTDISPENQQKIMHLSQQLLKYDLKKIRIVGHTDDIGDAQYNMKLSEDRAKSVADVFLSQGFTAQHLQIIGRGSSQPIVSNQDEASRAKNRRVAIIITP